MNDLPIYKWSGNFKGQQAMQNNTDYENADEMLEEVDSSVVAEAEPANEENVQKEPDNPKTKEKKELIRKDISDIQKHMFSELGISIGEDDPIIASLLYTKSMFVNTLADYESALTRVTLNLDKKLIEIHDFHAKLEENKKLFLNEIVAEHSKERKKTIGQVDWAIGNAINLNLSGFKEVKSEEMFAVLKKMQHLLFGVLAVSILNLVLILLW